MMKCSLMTFSFALIFLLCTNPPCAVFLDMDTNALSRIVEEHLDNYHVLVTHLTAITGGLYTRNVYIYFHTDLMHSQLLRGISTEAVSGTHAHPTIIAELTSPQINVEEGVRSLVVTLIPNTTIDLQSTFRHVKLRMHSKSKYYFLVVMEAPVEKDISLWIRDLFRVFWQRKHLNVVLMYWRSGMRIMSYSPFDEDFLLPLRNDIVGIDYLFPDRVINMNLKPLHVSLFVDNVRAIISPEGELSGADGYMTALMVERMNATLDLLLFTSTDPYGSLTNGSTNGSLWNVASGPSDVSFNNRFLIYSDFCDRAEATFIYGRDDLCILVPSTGLVPRFINIFRSFDVNVWTAIITILFFVFLSIRWTKWMRKRQGFPEDKNFSFMIFLRSHLNQTIPRISRNLHARIIIVFWIFYCIIITNAYLAHLTSSLMLRLQYPQINTLAEIEESNYTILAIPKYATLLGRNFNYTAHQNLMQRVRRVTFEEFHKSLAATNTDVAYAHKYGFLKHILQRKAHIVHNRTPYYLMRECPVPFFTGYIVKYGSPYLSRINTIMRRAQEVGLVEHWEEKMIAKQKIKGRRYQKSPNDPIPLKFSHVQAAFYMLAIGLVVGLVVFVLEVCHKNSHMVR